MKRIMVGKLSAEIPYLGKFSFSRFRAKRAQKKGKNRVFGLLRRIESLVFVRNGLK